MHSISAFACRAKIHLGQMIDGHMSVIFFQIYSMVVDSMCIVTEADQILISPKFVQILYSESVLLINFVSPTDVWGTTLRFLLYLKMTKINTSPSKACYSNDF